MNSLHKFGQVGSVPSDSIQIKQKVLSYVIRKSWLRRSLRIFVLSGPRSLLLIILECDPLFIKYDRALQKYPVFVSSQRASTSMLFFVTSRVNIFLHLKNMFISKLKSAAMLLNAIGRSSATFSNISLISSANSRPEYRVKRC